MWERDGRRFQGGQVGGGDAEGMDMGTEVRDLIADAHPENTHADVFLSIFIHIYI